MKKLFSIICAAAIFISLFASAATAYSLDSAETEIFIDGKQFKYKVIESNTVEITRGHSFIPTTIEGLPVTRIAKNAFWDTVHGGEDGLPYKEKDWVIPNTVTYIGDTAFYNCLEMRSIIIPESVEYIGKAAFKSCCNLKSVRLPEKITELYDEVFEDCHKLKSVEMNDNITKIGSNAFFNCFRLKKLDMSENIKEIGNHAFFNCKALKKIDFTSTKEISFGIRSIGYQYPYVFTDAIGSTVYVEMLKDEKVQKAKNLTFIGTADARSSLDYADKHGFEFLAVCSSKNKVLGSCRAGESMRLYVDRKKLKDFKTSSPGVIKLTENGRLTALRKGKAKISVTLKNGKKYKGWFKVKDNPGLLKKNAKGKLVKAKSVTVKRGKTVSLTLRGKARSIDNIYFSNWRAKIISKLTAKHTIKIKGMYSGSTTLKVRVNGVKTLKIKVRVK